MSDMENYLLSALFFLLLCGLFYSIKLARKKKAMNAREGHVFRILGLAQSQYEMFNIKMNTPGVTRNGLSAMLHAIDQKGLQMTVQDYVTEDWEGKPVEVFFRTRNPEGPVFYVFSSKILKIHPDYENSTLVCQVPENLRVEKKRHFIRVQPQKSDIRVIGVWPMQAGQTLPSATNEIGTPLTHYRPGMPDEPVQVENISASGLALRFPYGENGKPAIELAKGAQLLCLVVYVHEETDKPIAFWCTGEIMNSRIDDGPHKALVLGLEFTNWAVLEKGTSEIHWTHSSPTRGVRPIEQWVGILDKQKSGKIIN